MDFSRRDSSHKRYVLMLGAGGVKSRRRGFALGRGVTRGGSKAIPSPAQAGGGSLGFPLSLHTRWESDFLWTRGPVSGQSRTSGRIPVGSAWGILLLGFGQTGTGRLLCAESPLQGGFPLTGAPLSQGIPTTHGLQWGILFMGTACVTEIRNKTP